MQPLKVLTGKKLNRPGLSWSLCCADCCSLCDPMDCSPPGSSFHVILQARKREWSAMLSFRGSSQPRDQTQVSLIAGGFLTIWATREAQLESSRRLHPFQSSEAWLGPKELALPWHKKTALHAFTEIGCLLPDQDEAAFFQLMAIPWGTG